MIHEADTIRTIDVGHIQRLNNAARAARDEVRSWVGELRPWSFADTHGITEDEARLAIDMLGRMAERL